PLGGRRAEGLRGGQAGGPPQGAGAVPARPRDDAGAGPAGRRPPAGAERAGVRLRLRFAPVHGARNVNRAVGGRSCVPGPRRYTTFFPTTDPVLPENAAWLSR